MSQTFNRNTLHDNYEDAFFRIIMADYARSQGEILAHENEELMKDPANNPTPAQIKKFQRVLDKAFLKRAIKSALANSYRALSKVAVVVAILSFGFFITAMSVQTVRVNVLNFLIGFEKEYTSLYIGESGGNSIIGDHIYVSWTDAYVPTYIPNGFKITKLTNESDYKSINYIHADGRTIFYYEFSESDEVNLDTEDAERTENTVIQGNDALFVEKGGKLSVIWENHSKMFLISAEISEDELFMIAEGVKFITSP